MKSLNNTTMKRFISQRLLRLLMVLLVLPMALGDAWGSTSYGEHHASATTADPAQGLVYMNKSNQASVANSSFKNYYPGGSLVSTADNNSAESNACYISNGTDGCDPTNMFYWARPARGYEFNGSWGTRGTNYAAKPSSKTGSNGCDDTMPINEGPWTGTADVIQTTAGGQQATWVRPIASFKPATKYAITYAVPLGGSYSVHYGYITTYDTGETEAGGNHVYKFKDDGFDFTMTTATEEARVENSYAADTIILSVPSTATSFLGWYEDETKISESKTYNYTAHANNVTISPLFKEIGFGDASGDLTVNVGSGTEAELSTYGDKMVYIACPTLIGPWTSADFAITTTALSNCYGSIALGAATLNTTENRLEIPYSFTATHWGGIAVNVTVTPTYGEPIQFTIACSSEEVVGYEACIEESGVRTHTGTVAEMMAQANTMDNKPTVKLMNNGVTITTPVSFAQSMTFDVNGKVLTANCASAFFIDAEGIDVQIIDGSFTQVGEIHTSYTSNNAVSVVTFTQAAKLTMQGGTLSVANTGAGAAYGVDVCHGSIFYMTGGDLTVTASSGNAQGAHVATTSDYATFNGGSIAVSAPTNAYGLWSAGQSNITDATVTVETTTGANAYGLYVNGGISTITTTDFAVNAKTTNAYGAYVNAGRLNFNGGKLAVEAVTSDVYGVHVAAGATAMIQQGAKVTAEATGASGTKVFGINNLGTVSLNNLSVTVTSPTNYATAVNSMTSAVSTTIEDGTYTANTETGYAYGLHHQYGALNVDGGTFKGIVKTSGDHAYGARAAVNATIANATIWAETRGTANTAYGFVGGVANKTITLTNCNITAKSNTNKAYAIYSRTNVSATGCTLTATTLGTDQAYGLYAEDGTNSLTNTNATVTAQTVKAYGVNHVSGLLTVSGGTFAVEAKQGTASAAQNTELYGLYNAENKTTTVTNATFTVLASNAAYSQNVYGALINGTLNSTGAIYTAQAKLNVFGIWGNTASTLNLSGNTVSTIATNGTKSYGVYAKKNFTIDGDVISAQATTTDVYAMYFDATSVGEVKGGKFKAIGNGTTTYGPLNAAATAGNVQLKGGVYDINTNLSKYKATGYNIYNLDDTQADYTDGYYYVIATENPSPYVCKIVGGAHYTTLEAAMQYAKDNEDKSCTIVLMQNYTLPAGDYELPSNATLLIPHLVGQETIYGVGTDNRNKTTTAKDVVEFMRLTLAANAKLNVSGTIEVSAQMYCPQSGHISYINGPYSRIYMNTGSLIQLNDGAILYAWGKVSGSGEIKVKSNAEVREMFQAYGMPSMSNLGSSYSTASKVYQFFPVQQYEISNIEVPTTYYYNSRLVCGLSNYYQGSMVGVGYNKDDNIRVVGTQNALFLVSGNDESSWVRKTYSNSYMVWEANSSAKLGSLAIAMEEASMNSADYILPISTNMKIHILDGNFAVTQSTQLLPGSQIEIEKTGTLIINGRSTKNGDVNLYVFDADQSTFNSKPDALLNIHGKIVVEKDVSNNMQTQGNLFTTKSIADGTNATKGANIYSNNADAGTITYNANASAETSIKWVTGIGGSATSPVTNYRTVTMEPALLKNGDASYAETAGTTSGEAWIYLDGEWKKTYTNGCFEVIEPKVYAKPSGFVELKKTQTDSNSKLTGVEETNHTYLTVDDKLLILLDECQWWEVVATSDPTVFECTKPGYEGFYYYDETAHKWKIKTVTVTFYAAEEGDEVLKTIVTDFNGVPDQAVIAANPTKETTAAATYQFYGWKSSVSSTTYHWTATLETATDDMSYRPVFTENPRHYTVTFLAANNGANVPVEYAYGETPSYTPVKEPSAQYTYFFQYWLAADETTQYPIDETLPIVTEATVYAAIWSQNVNKYSVIWKNGEEVLKTDTKQAYGSSVSYTGETPIKETDDNFAYTHDGWSLTDGGEKLASLPIVSGEMTFYAHYSTTPRYKVTFANYDGTLLQQEQVTRDVVPVYKGLTPGRARDLDGFYLFIGWKNGAGNYYAKDAALPAVTGKETFTAQYDYVNELYLITLNNIDGAGATWFGKFGVGSIPYYNRDNNDVAVEPAKASTAQYEYTFSGWDPALEPVSGPATYTAQFEQHTRKYNITFANLDGNGAQQTIEVEYGTTPVSPVTPAKETATHTYDFLGWDPDLKPVSGPATYTAQFSATGTPRTFPITFDPDNGVDPIVVMNVAYGETPVYNNGTNPSKASDDMNDFSFLGWNDGTTTYESLPVVTGPAEYTAIYTPTIHTYTITFKNYDGATLKSSVLAYGATPTCDDPSKPVDIANRKSYTFSGWDDGNSVYAKGATLPSVSGEATYTAQYNELIFVAAVTTADDESSFHATFNDAITAANGSAGSTLKLFAKVSPSYNTYINVNMTIDLNGCEMSLSTSYDSNCGLLYVNNVALTVEDTKGNGLISFTGSGKKRSYYAIDVHGDNGSVTINNGKIQANRTGSNTSYQAAAVRLYSTNSKLYLYGGELIATASSGKGYAIYHDGGTSYGYLYIYGGKMKANTDIIGYSSAGRDYVAGGYYSKEPNSTITLATGCEIWDVEDEEPEKAEGYNYKVVRPYTIQFVNCDGRLLQSKKWIHGETPIYGGVSYVDNTNIYVFRAWKATSNSQEYTDPLPAATKDETYTAQYDVIPQEQVDNYVVEEDATGTVVTDTEKDATTVRVSGTLDIPAVGTTLTTNDFIIESTTNESGQVTGEGTLNVTGNAYFDVKFNGEYGTERRVWYAIAVPWEVDAETGIWWKEGNRPLVIGQDFDLIYYDGALRASEGPGASNWQFVQWDVQGHDGKDNSRPVDKLLHPGRLYMMFCNSSWVTVRFIKNVGSPIVYSGNTIPLEVNSPTPGVDHPDYGWNGIANPTLGHVQLEGTTVTHAQVVNNCNIDDYHAGVVESFYTPVDLSGVNFIVGKPLFVQTYEASTVVINPAGAPSSAPRRERTSRLPNGIDVAYEVHIAAENKPVTDNLFVQATEDEKADNYMIGKDLVKAGVATKRAQLWVNRYNQKLCVNTQMMENDIAKYPITIYVPQTGEYAISTDTSDDEYDLYLTFNGCIIWNLSNSSYMTELQEGNTTGYGLCISVKGLHGTEGIEEAIVDAQGETRKVVIDDKIYIIRENHVYSVEGRLVH